VAGGEGGVGDYPMEWVLPLLAGLGIGSLLKSIVDHFMARQANISDRWYQEKREAYLGLLKSLHDAALHPCNENSKAFALWQTRCELFGSKDVTRSAQAIVDTNNGPRDQRNEAFKNLLQAMKADLHTG
jgi:hypothetical protein